jgi:DNA uptake protein ComE-like DNA-binding protein
MKASHAKFVLRLSAMALLCSAMAFTVLAAQTSDKKTSSTAPSASSGAKVDLNTASEKDLEDLPGVGAATGKKIIAGRPYSSVDDLSKAGLSARVISKIAPLATVSGGGAMAAAAPKAASATKASKAPEASSASSGAPVDLNKASEKELEDLPGVGAATAKKIIAGRPYSSVGDLSKAGVSARVIAKIAPMATVSGGSAAAAMPAPAPKASTKSMPPAAPSAPASAPASPSAPSKPAPASSASQGSPGPGMVWVNLDSGIYHYPGTRYYGKTKTGKYLSEADAIKAGYHAAKDEKKPQ